MEKINLSILNGEILEYNTVIIGSGAAGLNCAIHLVEEGVAPWKIALVTEQLGGGTSFNAGSDKQTYYKMSIIGGQADSPLEMARDLFSGGAMHGDIALVESTNSIREFFHLIHLGVPFPHDKYGGFVGYKTDNDPKQRATSIGPYTSQEMCKRLLEVVDELGIHVIDNSYAIRLLVEENSDTEIIGLICIDIKSSSDKDDIKDYIKSINIYKTRNVVMATGGPSFLYRNSVYPPSQRGSTSLAIEVGCVLQNLTESQFGLASTQFRWNVSGSYQQVIPRYISIGKNGESREFLNDYFPSFGELSRATFLKGYQWPFSSERVQNLGSSLIDLAVYFETEIQKRNVFLDFTKNPHGYDFSIMYTIAKRYLEKSKSVEELPYKRLSSLNKSAFLHYKNHGIDLSKHPLQIAVCNQHLNGGVACDIWWESDVKHLFVIGEINGSHGIHRPGGAALNSGQVGGLRAAQKIAKSYNNTLSLTNEEFYLAIEEQVNDFLENIEKCFEKLKSDDGFSPDAINKIIQDRMEKFGGIIRPYEGLEGERNNIILQMRNLDNIISLKNSKDIISYFRIKDSLMTQLLFFSSLLDFHQRFGQSRGSFLVNRKILNTDTQERLVSLPTKLSSLNFVQSSLDLTDQIQTICLKNGKIDVEWVKVRKIPEFNYWFENVWKDFNDGKIIS